jgi:hypothetical protein
MQAKTPTQIYAMRAQNQTAIMGRKHSYNGIDIVMSRRCWLKEFVKV